MINNLYNDDVDQRNVQNQKPGGFVHKYGQKSKFLKSLKKVLELVHIVSRSYYNIIWEHFL